MRLAVVALALLAGCNPVAKIAQSSNGIRVEAQALVSHGQQVGDDEVVKRAQRIDGLAAGIHEDLADVEAKTNEWVSMFSWVAIATVAVVVLVVLWRSGAFTAIRIAIGWLPRRKVTDAELASKMLGDDEETPREYIAAKRASDAEFDAAWRRINKEKA